MSQSGNLWIKPEDLTGLLYSRVRKLNTKMAITDPPGHARAAEYR